ncbi:protein of unknown function [Nocardia cyriacigeorgica GUH-2]|uniref:Uncharacterized protein n=1 Tax=Nocardia cyriacigeorgica (strain GUH-2) TaxID=1127134 RepID=H6R784_NOCCG|nr:protein of unknown function [Nocardia cyriacigeorgica GUH-2]
MPQPHSAFEHYPCRRVRCCGTLVSSRELECRRGLPAAEWTDETSHAQFRQNKGMAYEFEPKPTERPDKPGEIRHSTAQYASFTMKFAPDSDLLANPKRFWTQLGPRPGSSTEPDRGPRTHP